MHKKKYLCYFIARNNKCDLAVVDQSTNNVRKQSHTVIYISYLFQEIVFTLGKDGT